VNGMSKEINNREYRQKVIKEIISELHAGKSVEEVQGRFAAAFDGVSAEEISQAEQALIMDGLPVSEVQRLCDVHAAVFKGSIEEIHAPANEWDVPGHPAHTMKQENRALEQIIDKIKKNLSELPDKEAAGVLSKNLDYLSEVDRHYLKKENLLFPYMEKYGITAPPKVMWGVDDEIRAEIREVRMLLQDTEPEKIRDKIESALTRVSEMIFKEENIMLPMLIVNLTEDDWKVIADGNAEFGYCLIHYVPEWKPYSKKDVEPVKLKKTEHGTIDLPSGELKVDEMIPMLNALPFDITFVDKDDTVKYFSQNAERIFPRTKSIIGRKVTNCHPPASVHIVEKIVSDFKAGIKDHEDFWIKMGEKYVLIRYFAVRDDDRKYIGTLEVTQNIKPIQDITGEKRLMSE
jgi:DUF438 domain-containing protein